MSFEQLDDPNPPSLDLAEWERIQRRSRALTRRRRVALTTTSIAGAVVLIVVTVGLVVAARGRGGDGVVTVGSGTTGVSTTTLDPAAWVTVGLHVDSRSIEQGGDLKGVVVFDNHRPVRVTLGDGRPVRWRIVVTAANVPATSRSPFATVVADRLDLAPGPTSFPFRVATEQTTASCDSLACSSTTIAAGPAKVSFLTVGPVEHLATPRPVSIVISGRGGPPPQPIPCPAHSPVPSEATGSYCGPAPHAGSGLGPNGVCTGRETVAPCGPGVIPGRYYAYTLPGSCSARIYFDGRRWDSELPPPSSVPDMDVWMRFEPPDGLGFISPNGAVGFRPHVASATSNCQPPG